MIPEKIEEIGVEPIVEMLQMVGGWPVLDRNWNGNRVERTTIANDSDSSVKVKQYTELTVENLLGKIRGDYNQPIIVEQYVGPDDQNSSHNIIQFDQVRQRGKRYDLIWCEYCRPVLDCPVGSTFSRRSRTRRRTPTWS